MFQALVAALVLLSRGTSVASGFFLPNTFTYSVQIINAQFDRKQRAYCKYSEKKKLFTKKYWKLVKKKIVTQS